MKWLLWSPARQASLFFVILLLATGLSLMLYGGLIHPAQLRAQATATVGAIQTTIARGTAEAKATAIANAHATATAVVRATAIAQATATAQQNFYQQATSGSPVLVDPLSGPSSSGWLLGSDQQTSCFFAGGALHSYSARDHLYNPCLALATNFANFTVEVDMRILRGDGGGLLFRTDANNNTGYCFFVGSDGAYSLFINDGQTLNGLIGGPSTAIHSGIGPDNLLTVIAQGNTITLYVNKQYVASIQDNNFGRGSIGVFAGNDGHVTEAAFNNLQVWLR
jgi:hypothetical protein